jgi:hypothetical protein
MNRSEGYFMFYRDPTEEEKFSGDPHIVMGLETDDGYMCFHLTKQMADYLKTYKWTDPYGYQLYYAYVTFQEMGSIEVADLHKVIGEIPPGKVKYVAHEVTEISGEPESFNEFLSIINSPDYNPGEGVPIDPYGDDEDFDEQEDAFGTEAEEELGQRMGVNVPTDESMEEMLQDGLLDMMGANPETRKQAKDVFGKLFQGINRIGRELNMGRLSEKEAEKKMDDIFKDKKMEKDMDDLFKGKDR